MAKKSKKMKLPKRFAGIKLSKALRRGPLAEMLMSPVGQGVLSEIIYHAGAALTERTVDGSIARGSAKAGSTAAHAGARAVGATYEGAGLLMHALREGATSFVGAVRQHRHSLRANEPDQPRPEGPAGDVRDPDASWRH